MDWPHWVLAAGGKFYSGNAKRSARQLSGVVIAIVPGRPSKVFAELANRIEKFSTRRRNAALPGLRTPGWTGFDNFRGGKQDSLMQRRS
jgi:hypothetical protein